ncbi:MAG: PilZ domain-containing protein [Candidatus Omnitrophica bacterium]|nr:PilZ domain-containing protein [Candidatus Omnitrophota bacterium]MCM8790272.1 PilZ domain-containing protein [Candidatus Omnitrophota bacterium]
MAQQERRKAPRIKDEELSLEFHAGNFDAVTHTLNISASGLYCKVDRDMPLMSRVSLVLMIPDVSKDGKEIRKVEVEGVVVRAHPVIIDGKIRHYDIAVFFDNLSSKAKELITNYISRKKSTSEKRSDLP